MKKLQSIIAILLLIVMALVIDQVRGSMDVEAIGETYIYSASELASATINETQENIFPHDEVIDVNIEIDQVSYDSMIENAMDESYVLADITYNGYTFNNVAIRPKGNSSLRDVVQSDSERLSFKVDFDKYVDNQNFFGVTKLNLNNIFEDPSLMAEYVSYEILDSIDSVASTTTYVSLSINGQYHGLYLAVEEVDAFFLEENYGNSDGELYKPDMGIGSDLIYISDDPSDYEGVEPQDDDMTTDEHFVDLVWTIDQIVKNGGESDAYKLTDVLNVDSLLKYLALSASVVHFDAYQGSMFHNYYLYYNTDTEVFEWISWDLNMTFNGFPMAGLSDEEATEVLIDEPVVGEMANYPLIEAVFSNPEYVDTYHGYIEEIYSDYLSTETFEATVLETYTMIESYASIDPTAFFEFDTVKESLFDDEDNATLSLLEFVELRASNIEQQLDGSIASTNDGNGNSGQEGMANKGGGMGDGKMGGKRPSGDPIPSGEQKGTGKPLDREGGPMMGEMTSMDNSEDMNQVEVMINIATILVSLSGAVVFVIYLAARKY